MEIDGKESDIEEDNDQVEEENQEIIIKPKEEYLECQIHIDDP